MKNLFTLIAFCLCLPGFSQWTWVNTPLIPQIVQRGMTFTDVNSGFVVGTNAFPNGNAMISRTTNGGISWSTVYSLPPAFTPSTLSLWDIQMVNGTTGFACGGYSIDAARGVIVKTTDGGATWDTIPHDITDQNIFLTLHFFDATHGLVAGFGLWSTSDGGLHWTAVTLPSGVENIQRFDFISPTVGFAVGYNSSALITTSDAGASWTNVSIPTSEVCNGVNFFDAAHGVVVCDNGTILYTTNGGSSWTSATNNDPGLGDVLCVKMTSASMGYAGTLNGKILRTTDGGASWSVNLDTAPINPVLLAATFYDIDFPTAQTGYACGSLLGSIFKTTNGGGAVGIAELRDASLRMSPNPAVNYINYDDGNVRTVQVFSSDGRLVKESMGRQLSGSLYVGDLIPGAYILKTFGTGVSRQGLFIKE
jgi:photosystem II stability/assembly factor-like uncharacterized protein